ncbi:MAG: nucleotide exchange factor GrpE [Gemmatimonadetes bacterium]|nr:nucleotide exchange factor GrpE [Gemmatimonadota bacterium]
MNPSEVESHRSARDASEAGGDQELQAAEEAQAQDAVADPPGDSADDPADGAATARDEAPDAEGVEDGEDVGDEAAADESDRLRRERDRYRDRHLRLAADFDNYRKRTEDRLGQRWDLAQAELVGRLLDPLDDLLRVTALEPESASVEAIVEGVEMVERKFLQVLEEAGVEIVDPLGEPFDPNTMEAMMRVPPESDDLEDTVERVFQRGYALRGHLVRPARVSVYKG